MPTYEYDCSSCGDFTAIRTVATRNEPCACPYCGSASSRVMISAPTLATMPSATRQAHATNERARHEPKKSGTHVHGPSCGCGSSIKNGSTKKTPDGAKVFPSKRPWMISH